MSTRSESREHERANRLGRVEADGGCTNTIRAFRASRVLFFTGVKRVLVDANDRIYGPEQATQNYQTEFDQLATNRTTINRTPFPASDGLQPSTEGVPFNSLHKSFSGNEYVPCDPAIPMEIVDRTLDIDLDSFLDRPLFSFLATASPEGHPRVSPLWFLWEDGCVWIIADTVEKSYTTRVADTAETAIAIVDFEPTTGLVQHVGMRGRSSIVPFDESRANRLLQRYLGPDRESWSERFVDIDPEQWGLIRFEPETVVARDQSFDASLEAGTSPATDTNLAADANDAVDAVRSDR